MAFDGISSILNGSAFSGNADDAAKGYLNTQTGAFDGITAPTLTPVQLQQQKWLGNVAPTQINAGADVGFTPTNTAQAGASAQGPSAYGGITVDPALEASQMHSIGALQTLADHGGMNATDNANLNRIQDSAAQADRGRRDAILQNAQERGMGGSGSSLAAQLSSSQAATTQQNQNDLGVAGQAQQRALDAMMSGGQLAGQVRSQSFGEQAAKAGANDAVSRFNAQNQTGVNEYNAGANNATTKFNATTGQNNAMYNRNTNLGAAQYNAQAGDKANYYNTTGQQNVANSGVDTANKQTMYNQNQLPTQNFGMQTQLAGNKSGAAGAGVKYEQGQSQLAHQTFGNMMGGAAQIGASALSKGGGAAGGAAAAGGGDSSSGASYGADGGVSAGAGDGGMGDTGSYWHGGKIPGHAKVPGDSPMNDTSTIHAAPGEVVLPRSVVNAAHPMASIKSFMGSLRKGPDGAASSSPDDLSSFLSNMTPAEEMHRDADFQAGTSGVKAGDSDDIVAKIAALSKMTK